jgi:hypothetical protein
VPDEWAAASDASLLGTWRHDHPGLSYEVTILPMALIFASPLPITEAVAWAAAQMVDFVREIAECVAAP